MRQLGGGEKEFNSNCNNLGGGGGKMKATKFGGFGVGMGGGLF
jgi:hypothetical protein